MKPRRLPPLAAPRLRRLIRAAASPHLEGSNPPELRDRASSAERCELCAEPIPPDHSHLLELPRRELRCACRACALLFDRRSAGAEHYRRVPDRLWLLEDLNLGESDWRALGVPVGTAFLYYSTALGAPIACYPGPHGATESEPDHELWQRVVGSHPALRSLEPDVEALLVHGSHGHTRRWLAPLDTCFLLVARVRMHWRGLSGGDEVWRAIDSFFAELEERSVRVRREDVPQPGPVEGER